MRKESASPPYCQPLTVLLTDIFENIAFSLFQIRDCLPPSFFPSSSSSPSSPPSPFESCSYSDSSGLFRRFVSRRQFRYLRMGATYFLTATEMRCWKKIKKDANQSGDDGDTEL